MRKTNTQAPDPFSPGRDARDKELFARYVAGDQSAFEQLYTLYERPLILYCQHMLRTQQEAQDAFQETWLRVIRVRGRGEVVEHFCAMVFTIARNVSLNRLNEQKQATMEMSINANDSEADLPATSVKEYNELEDLVNRALRRLPVSQREAFVLHAMLGYSFKEIAVMQGVSMTGAKTRAFRARSYVRKLLSNWLALAEDEPMEEDSPHRSSYSPQFDVMNDANR